MGAKMLKCCYKYKLQHKVFKLMNFLLNGTHKITLGLLLAFLIFFFEKLKFMIEPYGETRNLSYVKNEGIGE